MDCQKYLDALHREIKPALGCTEPIAVALAVAASMICIPTYGMNGVVAVLYLCTGGDMLAMALAAAKMYRDKAKGTK